MFTGNVTHKLDPKSRVAIPAGWRDAQGNTLWLIDTQNEGYPILKCYTKESFAEMVNGIRSQAEARGFDPAAVNRYIGTIFSFVESEAFADLFASFAAVDFQRSVDAFLDVCHRYNIVLFARRKEDGLRLLKLRNTP